MSNILSFEPGNLVSKDGELYRITRLTGLDTILVRNEDSGECKSLNINEISQPDVYKDDDDIVRMDLSGISDEDWEIARSRFNYISPILEVEKRTTELAKSCAESAGVHLATIYRWLDLYERMGVLSALLPTDRRVKRGHKLHDDVEVIIKSVIDEYFLKTRKPSQAAAIEQIETKCKNAKLKPPHKNTIRSRLRDIKEKEKIKKREGKNAAKIFNPVTGDYDDAKWILSVVQIDHTKANIIVVDEVTREPICRPWMTVAIDVFSRVIHGVYVSLNPPSADSVGLCLANAILPKDKWLVEMGVDQEWPIWGPPDAVHSDNAKEFRGQMVTRAANEYNFDIYWRPVGKPEYGAHIERLLGTFKREIEKELSGTTFANPVAKGEYNSEKKSAMTLREFEKWLVEYITGVYHQKKHDGIGMPPIKKYEEGVFGTISSPGRGLPSKIVDEERLYIDFLPVDERTVQQYGIVWDDIYYYKNVLKRWINEKDPDNKKFKRKFIVRRNPRDISTIYFYDPEMKEYFEIPYRDSSHPAISLWELQEVKNKLKQEGISSVNEDIIFDTYEHMREIEQNAVKETKRVRRANQRRKEDARSKKPKPQSEVTYLPSVSNIDMEDIQPFDNLEELV